MGLKDLFFPHGDRRLHFLLRGRIFCQAQNRSYINSSLGGACKRQNFTWKLGLPNSNVIVFFSFTQPNEVRSSSKEKKSHSVSVHDACSPMTAWCRTTQQGKHACVIGIEAVRAHRIVSVHRVWWDGGTMRGPWVWAE